MKLSNISSLKRSITSGLSSSLMKSSQKSQQETFLTLQQRSMSQISNDSTYPTEFRKATEQYIYASDRLKESQLKKAQEAEHLKYKQQFLEQQAAELQRLNNEISYMKVKQAQQIGTIKLEIQEKEDQLSQIMQQISKNIDVCACLSSLQQIVQQRLQNYKEYAAFCQQVHEHLISSYGPQSMESNTHSGYFINKLDNLLETNRFLRRTLETVKFQKNYQEQQENQIETDEHNILESMDAGTNAIFAISSANQGQFNDLMNELMRQEQENTKLQNQEAMTKNQLQQLTEALNSSFEAVGLLFKRVENQLEGRHKALGDRAAPADLLGGNAERLNAAAATIAGRSGGLISFEDAKKKVFPSDLETALRNLFKLKLYLDDQEQVINLYEQKFGPICK